MKEDPRIILIKNEINEGIMITRNKGIRQAKGRYICILDADDTLAHKDILEYIETGEPMDKAGSYAIQGIFGKYIDKYQGDYDNVVGLPANRLVKELKENFDVEI